MDSNLASDGFSRQNTQEYFERAAETRRRVSVEQPAADGSLEK